MQLFFFCEVGGVVVAFRAASKAAWWFCLFGGQRSAYDKDRTPTEEGLCTVRPHVELLWHGLWEKTN